MPTAILSSKGQVVIPKAIRDKLHLHPGDRVDFTVNDQGVTTLSPVNGDIDSLKGVLARYAKERNVTVDDMNKAIRNRKVM